MKTTFKIKKILNRIRDFENNLDFVGYSFCAIGLFALVEGTLLMVTEPAQSLTSIQKQEKAAKNLLDCVRKGPFKIETTQGPRWFVMDSWKPSQVEEQGNRISVNLWTGSGDLTGEVSYSYNLASHKTDYADLLDSTLNPRVVRSLAMQRLNYCVTGYMSPANPR